MTAGAPWSVKGIDPKAREIAKDLARRSGMTLGEWLNQVILEDEAPLEDAPRYPTFGRHALPTPRRYEAYARPVDDAFRVTDALERLSARIEAAEQRAGEAIGGIDEAVAHLLGRLDLMERDQSTGATRIDGVLEGLRTEQARESDRLRKIEQDRTDSRTGDVLKALESALVKVASQVLDGQTRDAEVFDGLRQELDGVHESLEGALTEDDSRALIEEVVGRLTGRLEQTEQRTTEALRSLESALGTLDARIKTAEDRLGDRGDDARYDSVTEQTASLAEQLDAMRAEMAEAIRASADHDRFERMDQALRETTDRAREAEQTAAGAIEKIGGEVLRVADAMARRVEDAERRSSEAFDQAVEQFDDKLARSVEALEDRSDQAIARASEQFGGDVARMAETLTRNVEDAEHRSAEAIERVGSEVGRVAGALEQRLTQADTASGQALERLGGEIARITERLTERVANAERRSAQAIDDVGEQVARVTERLQDRQERTSTDLAERIRLSEERTARLLEEARERIDQRLAGTQRRLADTAPSHAAAFDAYADPAVAPFGDGSFIEPAPAPTQDFNPVGDAADFDPAEEEAHERAFAPAEPEAEPEAQVTSGDDELFAAEPRPFGHATSHIEHSRAEDEPDDFGAGLFAEPEAEPAAGIESDDDWLTPAVADDETPHPHAIFGRHAVDDSAHRDDATAAFDLAALAGHGSHDDPDASADFEAADDFVQPQGAGSKSTRELVEQARAAARAASPSPDGKPRGGEPKGGSLFGGFGLGGKKKRGGTTMRTALLVSGGTAALGVALAGYVILADKPHGAIPARVASALGLKTVPPSHPVTGELSPNPLAAVALAPKPIASQVAAAQQPASPAAPTSVGGAELYNDAVRRIEAQDKTGVAPLEKAANLGYAPAQFYLAKLYEDGQAGLPKDLVQARTWTERAAEGGDRKAMHNLALYSFEGVGGPKNLTSAAEWFRRAADLGLVDSQYNLARLYEEGFGVAQNPAEAYKWYLIAGHSGDAESRMSALRIKGQLSAEAQSAAERAAEGFQSQSQATADTPPAKGGAASPGVALAQRALSKLGFYQGPTDGTATPALTLAIAAYQRGQGLPATGQIDPALTQKLTTVLDQ